MQWGYKNQNNNYMVRTLPISCNEILVGVATPFGSYEHGCGTFNYTQTTISIRTGNGVDGRYIAICKQQWGIKNTKTLKATITSQFQDFYVLKTIEYFHPNSV